MKSWPGPGQEETKNIDTLAKNYKGVAGKNKANKI